MPLQETMYPKSSFEVTPKTFFLCFGRLDILKAFSEICLGLSSDQHMSRWAIECSLWLIFRSNIDLIIPREAIHEGHHLIECCLIYYHVYIREW